MISLTRGLKQDTQLIDTHNRLVVARGWGEKWEKRVKWVNGYKLPVIK